MTSAEVVVPRRSSNESRWTGRRLVALVLFLGLPLVAVGVAGIAVTAGLEASQVADHAEATTQAIIHQLDRRPAASRQPIDTTPRYLSSGNASLARAELQALAGGLVERAGGRVIEVQSTDANEADAANHVSVDVTFDATNAELFDILYEAESGLPLLTVPRLEARSEPVAEGRSGASPSLRVTMTVQGTWKGAAP